jgi:hypothetical protein
VASIAPVPHEGWAANTEGLASGQPGTRPSRGPRPLRRRQHTETEPGAPAHGLSLRKHSWNRCTNFTPLINRCCADHRKLPGPTADRRRLDPSSSEGSAASHPARLPHSPGSGAGPGTAVRRGPVWTARIGWENRARPPLSGIHRQDACAGTCGWLLGDQPRRDRANRGHPAHDTRCRPNSSPAGTAASSPSGRSPASAGMRGAAVTRRPSTLRGRHTHAPQELWGQPVRVIEISPGLVETELSRVRFGVDEQRAAAVDERVTLLSAAEHSGLRNMGSDAPAACQRRRGRRDGTSAGSGFSDSRSTATSRRLNGW